MVLGSFLTASHVLGWCLIASFAYQFVPSRGATSFPSCARSQCKASMAQCRRSITRLPSTRSASFTSPLLRQLLRLGGQARYLRICLCQREIVLLQLPNCSWLEFCSRSLCNGGEVSDVTSLTFLISSSLNSISQVGGLRTLQDCRRLSCEQLRVEIVDCTSSAWTTRHRDLWSWLVDSAAARSLSQISRLLLRHLLPMLLVAAGRRDLLVQVLNLTDQLCPVRLEVRLRLERPVELLDRWHIPVALFPTEDLPPLFVGYPNAHARLAPRRSREMRQLEACNFFRRWTTLSICAGLSAPDAAALFQAITPRSDLAVCRAQQFFSNTYDVPEARIKHSWLGAPCCTHINCEQNKSRRRLFAKLT